MRWSSIARRRCFWIEVQIKTVVPQLYPITQSIMLSIECSIAAQPRTFLQCDWCAITWKWKWKVVFFLSSSNFCKKKISKAFTTPTGWYILLGGIPWSIRYVVCSIFLCSGWVLGVFFLKLNSASSFGGHFENPRFWKIPKIGVRGPSDRLQTGRFGFGRWFYPLVDPFWQSGSNYLWKGAFLSLFKERTTHIFSSQILLQCLVVSYDRGNSTHFDSLVSFSLTKKRDVHSLLYCEETTRWG